MDQENANSRLETILGRESCENLLKARAFSEERIIRVGESLASYLESLQDEQRQQGFGWVATGSLGRLEALEASDIDLMLLVPSGVSVDNGAILELDQAAREWLRKSTKEWPHSPEGPEVKVSEGRNLTSPAFQDDITSPKYIGGDQDTVAYLTKRILLLTESRAVLRSESRASYRDAIFGAYFEQTTTKGRHLLSLINDLTRYYRTVCVDYKSRVDAEGKPWAIRNMKLRHARKYWFFSTMMAALAAAARFEHDLRKAESEAKELLDQAPTERLLWALEKANMLHHLNVIFWYDRFLGMIGDPGIREELDRTSHAERHRSDAFRRLSENSENLHVAMLEIIEALPPNWRRHLLSHFLL